MKTDVLYTWLTMKGLAQSLKCSLAENVVITDLEPIRVREAGLSSLCPSRETNQHWSK